MVAHYGHSCNRQVRFDSPYHSASRRFESLRNSMSESSSNSSPAWILAKRTGSSDFRIISPGRRRSDWKVSVNRRIAMIADFGTSTDELKCRCLMPRERKKVAGRLKSKVWIANFAANREQFSNSTTFQFLSTFLHFFSNRKIREMSE